MPDNHEFAEGQREARIAALESRLIAHEERNERRFEMLGQELDQLKKISYILLATVALTNTPAILSLLQR